MIFNIPRSSQNFNQTVFDNGLACFYVEAGNAAPIMAAIAARINSDGVCAEVELFVLPSDLLDLRGACVRWIPQMT